MPWRTFPISGRAPGGHPDPCDGAAEGRLRPGQQGLAALLDATKADAIIAAAKAIADGTHDAEFPIDVFQTGSGTSSNMNTNEVIASHRRKQDGVEVHPNDDVNMGQSSNDTFPTATHVAATEAAVTDLIPGPVPCCSESLAKPSPPEWESRRQVRPHPPHGCRTGHPRPGVRRLRPPNPGRH